MAFDSSVRLLLVVLVSYFRSLDAQNLLSPTSNASISWTNNPSSCISYHFDDGSRVRLIASPQTYGSCFAFGFYCNGNCSSFYLSVFVYFPAYRLQMPQAVWTANRNHPVGENATLEFTRGGLVLRDSDGTFVWSPDTEGKAVAGMKLTETGNLVLFDAENGTIWQSYDHPTDTLVVGQKLAEGQKLVASASEMNFTEGLFSFAVTSDSLVAFVGSDPSMNYYNYTIATPKTSVTPTYMRFRNGSLAFYVLTSDPDEPDEDMTFLPVPSIQYMRLGSDGHLRVYEWDKIPRLVTDLLSEQLDDECSYPMACGKYGLCTKGQCSCPGADDSNRRYFTQVDDRQPNLGCAELTPLSREDRRYHRLLSLKDVYYFRPLNYTTVDVESCRQACLSNSTCVAAMFNMFNTTGNDSESDGYCFMHSEIYSLTTDEMIHPPSTWFTFLKVQVLPSDSDALTPRRKLLITFSIVLPTVAIVLVFSYVLFRITSGDAKDEYYLGQIPGMPTRFSYEELKLATGSFCEKLGQGGFGSVYKGALADGTQVAVKRLDGLGHMEKSFLAEVETIGGVHHVNLVRLIGYCADKSRRLLVYEYMCNGSLDKWIFPKNDASVSLGWETRKKIIYGVARGLAYLHEECRQKILHLDIKPQNILLDSNLVAKVSDFGLSKLIDKDQSKIMTAIRGTPGYLAPEWLSMMITDKVDVYSFGIVMIEILCGRKNLDFTRPEEGVHLLRLLEKHSENDFHDIIDNRCEDMHREEAVEMMKVAGWCLQNDFSRRPSMLTALKVLDGGMEIEPNLNFNLVPAVASGKGELCVSSPLLPSLLSGPR